MGTVSVVAAAHVAAFHPFNVTIGALALLLPCIAFAWDGLVRRGALVSAFPVGATLGQQAALITRFKALAVGGIAGLLGIFLLLVAWGTWLVAAEQLCHHDTPLACMGTLLDSAEWPAWAWFALFALWFGFVWLRMGDPRQRVLVFGVWYHQERVARLVNQCLGTQGLAPLPRERLYLLEGCLVNLMRTRGWLARGTPAWSNAGLVGLIRAGGLAHAGHAWIARNIPQPAHEPSPETMMDEVLSEPANRDVGASERAAVAFLLTYFVEQAQRAERMSPLRLWWVGSAQMGKRSVYGQRAL